jgi:hypothetical protein
MRTVIFLLGLMYLETLQKYLGVDIGMGSILCVHFLGYIIVGCIILDIIKK